jgi:hypothetical protein
MKQKGKKKNKQRKEQDKDKITSKKTDNSHGCFLGSFFSQPTSIRGVHNSVFCFRARLKIFLTKLISNIKLRKYCTPQMG